MADFNTTDSLGSLFEPPCICFDPIAAFE